MVKNKKKRPGERKEKSLTVDPTAGGRKGRKRQADFTLREREAGLPDEFHLNKNYGPYGLSNIDLQAACTKFLLSYPTSLKTGGGE